MSHFTSPNGCTSHRVNRRLKRLSALPLSIPGQCCRNGIKLFIGQEGNRWARSKKQTAWVESRVYDRESIHGARWKWETSNENKSLVKSFLSGKVNTTPLDLLSFYSTLICSVCRFHRIRSNKQSEFNDENVEQAKSGYFTCCTECLLLNAPVRTVLLCFSALTCLQLHWELFAKDVTDWCCVTSTLGGKNRHNSGFRVCLTCDGMLSKRSLNQLKVNKNLI